MRRDGPKPACYDLLRTLPLPYLVIFLIIMIRTINSYLCMSMCNNPMPYASMPYAQFLCLPFMDFPLFIALVTYPLP